MLTNEGNAMEADEQEPPTIEALDSIKQTSQTLLPKLSELAERAAQLHPGVIDPVHRQFFRDVIAVAEQATTTLGQHVFLSEYGSDNYPWHHVPDESNIPIDNAESIVIGLCMCEPCAATDATSILKPEHFSVFEHQVIFGHIVRMRADGKEPELHLLAEQLRVSDQLESIGGVEYLTALVESVIPYTNVDDAIQSVWHLHHNK